METKLLTPSVKIYVFLLIFLLPIISYSQIWQENFSYPDGTTVGTGNRWTATTVTGNKRYFEVRSNRFAANNTDGQKVFTTEPISISGFTNVSLSVNLFEQGNMEASDYIRIYYQIDTGSGYGAETLFATNGNNIDDWTSRVATQTGLNGLFVKIIIKQKCSAVAETHFFDNIIVDGTVACTPVIVAPTVVTASPSTILNGSANLNATSTGNTINWYTVASGGTRIGSSASGVNFSVSPTSTTTYYAEADDGSCPSATRTSVTVTVLSYCSPTYASGPGFVDQITNVTLGTLNNTSSGSLSSPYYTFYKAVVVPDLTTSTTASVSITFGSDVNQYAAVWIDFNQNGIFDASEGVVSSVNAGANGTTVINVLVPASALTGNTRMRVRGGDDSALTTSQACSISNSTYGETEDYIVNIISACTNPAQPSVITGLANPCVGTSQTYSVTNVSGVTYNWTLPSGWTQTAGGNTNSITVTVGSGSGSIGVVAVDGTCTSTARTLSVTSAPEPSQPSIITGNTSVCIGSSKTYSVTNVSGVTYNWILPSGWTKTAGGTTNSITVTVGSGSGNIKVTPSNGTCNGVSRTLAVTSGVPVQPSSITGNVNVCGGSTETYSVTNVAGVSYNWTVPTGWSINSGNGTNSITVSVVGVASGNIEVTPSNSCGSGTLKSLAVSSSAIAQPSLITGSTVVCKGNTETYSVVNVSGLSYNWTLPTGWTIDSGNGTNSITVTVGSGSGNIKVTPSNGCGGGTPQQLAVTSNILPTITGTTPGSRNGPGTVVLKAKSSITGSTVSLYANATGGVALASGIDSGSGVNLTTPGIIATTTYYVDTNKGPCFSTPRVAVTATVHYSEITVKGNGNIILDEDDTPIEPDYTNLGPTPINVGLTRLYTIKNTGTINLTIGTINITGVDHSDFVVTTAPATTVVPGGNTTFKITFTPTTLGIKNASVSFITNDPDKNPFNFDIRGTGSTGLHPEIKVQGLGNDITDGYAGIKSTDGTNFGSVIIPGTIVRTFTIKNRGTGPLLLTDTPMVRIIGSSYFTVTTQPSSNTIAAGGSLTFQVTFNPSVTGTFDAIVNIGNDDTNVDVYDFAIQGSATVSGREIDIQGNEVSIADGDTSPSVLDQTDFGITDTSTPIPHTFNIYSLGSARLTINSTVTISGADKALFSASTIANTSLAAGAITSFVITFTPTASLGVKNATIIVKSNDPDEGTYNFNIRAEVQTLPVQTLAPGGITSNLKFWLKADSNIGSVPDNSSIITWEDQTFGSTKNAISRTLKEPKFQNNSNYNVNFNPVVHFDGNDYMSGGQGFNNADMFIVLKPSDNVTYTSNAMDIYCGDDITTNRGNQDVTGFEMGNTSHRHTDELLAYNQGDEKDYGISEINTPKFYSGANIFNPRKHVAFPTTKMNILHNGNTLGTSTVNNNIYLDIVNSRYWLGRSERWDASYDGDILEVINYNSRNNDVDKRKIETYLAIKYGITLGVNGTSVDYKDSGNTTIYDAGASYNYNIAGIGRDDASGLNQKQSKSENAKLIPISKEDITIGLGDIYDVNSNNPNSFANDRDFLVWGHDNHTLLAQTPIVVNISSGISPTLTTDVEFISIGKTWRVVESGGNVPSCKVSIPRAVVDETLSPPGDYLMLISDSPVFNDNAEYRIMKPNGIDLQTNYDFNGIKYITFGYAPERKFSRSIQFDGVKDYLDAGDVLDLNPNEFTISAWVKRGSSSGNKSILSKRDAGYSNGGYDFKITSTGKVEMSWKNGGTQTITSNTKIPTNVWHQVAVIYNGTNASLYIDGVLDSSVALSAPVSPSSNSASFIIAAAGKTSTTAFFKGNIDEVRVWNVALTTNQLRYIMNQEIEENATFVGASFFISKNANLTKNEVSTLNWSNLKGYYPMSTYTFTNCKDESGNGNIATLKNLRTVDWQTAPLPYVSTANDHWGKETTWKNGNLQTIPGAVSIVDNSKTVDWNIVQVSSNVTMRMINAAFPSGKSGNKKVLGLLVDNPFELTVEGSTTLSANSNSSSSGKGSGLTVTHYLGLDGKIDLEGESQLIQTLGSDLVVGTNGMLERDQQGIGNIYRYNDWSSPVYSKIVSTNKMFTIADVLKDGTDSSNPKDINFVGGYDGATGSPIQIADYWLYVRNANPFTSIDAAWDHIGSTGNIQIGAGFLMKGTGSTTDQNYVFQGKPNNGDITVTVKDNNDYLVGNPYPSAIDADKFIADNAASIQGTIYFWDHFGGNSHILKEYVAGHATYNLMGGVEAANLAIHTTAGASSGTKKPGRFIAVGQAFYVDGKGTGNQNVVFKNSQRVFKKEETGVSVFMKPSKKVSSKSLKSNQKNDVSEDLRTKFRIGFNAVNGGHRQLLIGFDERASDAVDYGFDGLIKELNNDDMYWEIDNKKYIIQGTNDYSLDSEFPLGITLKEAGLISIEVDELENVGDDTKLYIKDNFTGETYDISTSPVEFNLEAGEYSNRFFLVFQPRLLAINEISLNTGLIIYMDKTRSELNIKKIIDTKIISVQLFNTLGQLINSWNNNLEERLIPLPVQATTGMYIVKVNTTNGTINKKIIIE